MQTTPLSLPAAVSRPNPESIMKNHEPPPFHPASATDFLPVPQLRDIQLARLREMVQRAFDRVALFRKRMDARGLSPGDLQSLEDLAKLPFTVKSDLRDSYPFGLFASPLEEIVRFHASSGTTGKPIVVAYTKEDLQDWSNAMMRSFAACGVHAGDIVQNAYGYGLFTGGLGAHYGAEALGASVIPISGGNTERQIMVLKDFGVTVLCCTPSYFIHLIERAGELGVSIKELPLRIGVFGAEPWTESMRQRIEAESCIKAYDIYGLSEIVGPGVAMECVHQAGPHIFEDLFYPEVIDPETCQVLPDGAEGELVLTTLCKRAMPMIRYRTRDISAITSEPCPCGRTMRRIRRISRRSDDMLIIRGVNVFPSQIEAALLRVEGTLPHYQIIVGRERGLDTLEVQVEVTAETFSDTVGGLETLRRKLAHSVESITGIHANIRLVAPHTLQRSEGKAKRVTDQRKL
jgi:phenylacetate-CoA ligase